MEKNKRRIEVASYLTLILTIVLFAVSLITKGFTHELLLESGVFLVSLKLVLSTRKLEIQLEELSEDIKKLQR